MDVDRQGGVRGLENWTTFMDDIFLSSLKELIGKTAERCPVTSTQLVHEITSTFRETDHSRNQAYYKSIERKFYVD